MEKGKVAIYKKWWFWLIILAIVIIISGTLIIMRGFSITLDEVGRLAIDVQNIYDDATVYTSAGDNTIVIELRNWDNAYGEALNKITETVKNKIKNGELRHTSK